jgi:hypothetical protein
VAPESLLRSVIHAPRPLICLMTRGLLQHTGCPRGVFVNAGHSPLGVSPSPNFFIHPTTELFHPPSIKSWRRAGVSCEDCTGTGFGWSLLIIIWLATTHAGSFSPNSLMPMENKPTAKPTQQRELMNFQQSSPVGRTCWLEPRFVSVDI